VKKAKDAVMERGEMIQQLRSSPIRGITPISPDPIEIDLDQIETDPTNPGADETKSLRYQRRQGSIRDSYDIMGSIVYPPVVCQHAVDRQRYIHVDGYGRLSELRSRGVKRVRAFIFPPLTLEQRICLRETLNAAEEPFDAVSVLQDLRHLGKERGLDLANPEQVRTLVRDLPEKVQNFEDDLVLLGRWHPEAVAKLGESYSGNGQAIGIDKFRELDGIIAALRKRHPKTLEKLGGEKKLSLQLARMYVEDKFRMGARSQHAIRSVKRIINQLPPEHEKLFAFFDQQLPWTALPAPEPSPQKSAQPADLVEVCKQFTAVLLEVDEPSALSVKERRALDRTSTVLNQVLGRP
jgi:hypothetical protein